MLWLNSSDTMSSESGSIKRRKTAPIVGLESLPDQLLASVSEYLVIPSRLMLAVALTAPASSPRWRESVLELGQLSQSTKALLTNSGSVNKQWERVDFGHLGDGDTSSDEDGEESSDEDGGESSDDDVSDAQVTSSSESTMGHQWGTDLTAKLTDDDVGQC